MFLIAEDLRKASYDPLSIIIEIIIDNYEKIIEEWHKTFDK